MEINFGFLFLLVKMRFGEGYKMNNLQMITQEELTKLIHCSEAHMTFLRELGIIPAIKTGRNYMFSPTSIQNFLMIMLDLM